MLDSSTTANRLIVGDAAEVIERLPDDSVDLVVTSPPYWDAVEYAHGRAPWGTYEDYLNDMMRVWKQCYRVLRPNGKMCINTPIMPIPKNVISQHTRHIKNIAFDLEHLILSETSFERFSLFVWQKQTSKMMFGSYPYPGNILENNTIEFINVYVKGGKPPKFDPELKEANRLSRTEWLDLTQQVWFMYPEDVKRESGHPAPFPIKLPARLLMLYTYGAYEAFQGETVLDPFVGLGTTCVAAKAMGRQYIGIDLNREYIEFAQRRIERTAPYQPLMLVGRPKYPSKDELIELAAAEAGSAGKDAEKKHKRQTYGRSVASGDEDQLTFL
ncbi:DNA-methyltransferase [Sulfitobacter sabulilitoris]|uniref:Methyltransferase n=1 Tax=Sulfitobacter sabulilitoris TaxID=2562655 RepID=A0A5S3PK55_9RHOB|nr:site-specific DNA-methyltransferase [Sulfitobacter sabulilitoris]TMM54727.1 site-specific DNA-methyltransferase [Sulfitobacter sabulilitoris]